jgi:hypothetical protein
VEERVLFDGWSSSENLEGEFCVAGSKRHGRMRLWNWIWSNVVEKMKRGVYWIECDWRIKLLLWLILWDENEKNPITFVVCESSFHSRSPIPLFVFYPYHQFSTSIFLII